MLGFRQNIASGDAIIDHSRPMHPMKGLMLTVFAGCVCGRVLALVRRGLAYPLHCCFCHQAWGHSAKSDGISCTGGLSAVDQAAPPFQIACLTTPCQPPCTARIPLRAGCSFNRRPQDACAVTEGCGGRIITSLKRPRPAPSITSGGRLCGCCSNAGPSLPEVALLTADRLFARWHQLCLPTAASFPRQWTNGNKPEGHRGLAGVF